MNTLSVEVIKKNQIFVSDKIIDVCDSFLKTDRFRPGTVISKFKDQFLTETVQHIIIGDHSSFKNSYVDFTQVCIKWFVYTLDQHGEQIEADLDENGETIQLAKVRLLPSVEYFNLWENLIYDTNVKDNLLNYATTSMLYAAKGVDCNVVSCNRVVLLHGPPGTGKTSLCKALAQKLSVRLNNRFKRGFLLEINSHSLFSKWFSESGKLVTKMFDRIRELLQDPDVIIFVLIDEIESLTHAREKSISGNDPSDSIRVVNAVLTQIDQIRHNSNVLILTTSNMTAAIDLAFVDRADIKFYIGLPSPEAIFQIYYSCIKELCKAQIISPMVLLHYNLNPEHEDSDVYSDSNRLHKISKLSVGLSGRMLRKVPFLAHALFLEFDRVEIHTFFDAMVKAINSLEKDKLHFS